MIKAILFDLDNTLIDFMKMKQKSCESAVDAMISAGLKTDRKKALKTLFQLYDTYGIEYQQIFEKLLKKLNGKVDYRIVAHGVIAYRKLKETQLNLYPGAMQTLIELKKKYKLGIVTDAPRINAWQRLVALNIDDFFDVVITAADVRKQKTSTAPFKAALKALKIKPEEALMVGDRIKRDIVTARKLGIRTCYAKYGDTKKVNGEGDKGIEGRAKGIGVWKGKGKGVDGRGGGAKGRGVQGRVVGKGKSGADWEIDDIRELMVLKGKKDNICTH